MNTVKTIATFMYYLSCFTAFAINASAINIEKNLSGDYECNYKALANVTGVKTVSISQNGEIKFENKYGFYSGNLIDYSNYLSPIEKDFGFQQFQTQISGYPVTPGRIKNLNFIVIKITPNKLLFQTWYTDNGFKTPYDNSNSDNYRMSINPDIICEDK